MKIKSLVLGILGYTPCLHRAVTTANMIPTQYSSSAVGERRHSLEEDAKKSNLAGKETFCRSRSAISDCFCKKKPTSEAWLRAG